MPDSDWTLLQGIEHQRYEESHQRDEPPDPDFTLKSSEARSAETVDAVHTILVEIWQDIDIDQQGRPVSEFCTKCAEHVHDDEGLTDAEREHLLDGMWGDRRGLRYANARVTGVEIRRLAARYQVVRPIPGRLYDTLDHTSVFWQIRNIDHVVDGIFWNEWQLRPCDERGNHYVGLQQLTDELAAAVGRATGDNSIASLIVANDFTDLLLAASRIRKPGLEMTAEESGTWTIAARDAAAPGEAAPIATMRVVIREGRLIPADR